MSDDEMTEPIDTTDPTDTDAPTDTVTDRGYGPRWLPATLVVLATVLAVVSTLTTWVRSQALDTDEWVEVSQELLAEPEVQTALSTYLANELFAEVDVADQLQSLLPDDLAGLAGPLAGALRAPATEAIDRLISSERFEQIWVRANRAAHTAVVAVLRGESRRGLTTSDGSVVLELGDAVRAVGENIGLPEAALERIPETAGQIVILDSEELADAQDVVQVIDFTSWFLFFVVVAMYVTAVALAAGRRRTMLRLVGISIIVGGVVLLAIRAIGLRTSVALFVEDPANESLAVLVGSVLTELLQQMAWTGIVYGVLLVAFAEVLGDHRWAVAVRRAIGRASESTGWIIGSGVVLLLLLVWWSPGRAFDRWVTALTLIGLVVGGIVTLIIAGRRELTPEVE